MRLDRTRRTEWFGAVRLHECQRVIELDSGETPTSPVSSVGQGHHLLAADALAATARQMAIVVPCRNETVRALEGVLSGIPHECLVIVVSASARQPVDRFEMEGEAVRTFCDYAQRSALAVHQYDPGLAGALATAGASGLVGDDGLVRAGKGEAMVVGLAIAALTDRRYVGYVDVDNLVPGAVNEYCRVYAAGLLMADTPYAMVRIAWQSKPKVRDGRMFFNRRGRASEVTNRFLNQLVGEYGDFGTDVVTTGNAGDHAISLALALRLRFAGGFAAETYELLDLLEQFGGVFEPGDPEVMANSVSVRQVETRNPHLHQDRGEDHVDGLRREALSALYHSRLCSPAVRADVTGFLVERGLLRPDEEPPRIPVYPPVASCALDQLRDLLADAGAVRQYGSGQAFGRESPAS